jgi:hypothetical protein
MGGLIRRAAVAAGATALVLAGTLTAAHASTTAPVPPGVQVSQMTYQPGMHLPATALPRFTPVYGTLTSQNWAGYVDVACRTCALRFVTASFTLPSVNCARSPDGSVAGFWAGLDGVTDTTVEQIGAAAGCSRGAVSYAAFYEMYPNAPVYFSGVRAGDSIKVSVFFNASTARWQLRLSDLTTGGSISTAQRCPSGSRCRNADAEVITEIPSLRSGTVPLADFGQVRYRAIQVTSRQGLKGAMTSNGQWTTHAIDMRDSAGHNLALPGSAGAGQAFRITWYAAS